MVRTQTNWSRRSTEKNCWKSINNSIERNILQAAGSLQICGGLDARSEAGIHVIYDGFSDNKTEGILLIDGENAFNSINRKVMLHNLKFICPFIATYISNCYMCPAKLFINGGGELISKEGTTQGDPTSMGASALGIIPLLQFLLDFISVNKLSVKGVAFADDFTFAGKLSSIKDYWSQLTSIGPKYGFFPKALKYFLIVKEDQLPNATTLFDNSNVNITVEGKKHLGGIVESGIYKGEYVDDLVKDWNSQLCILSTATESQHIRDS